VKVEGDLVKCCYCGETFATEKEYVRHVALQHNAPIPGVGPDAPIVTNENGGMQSQVERAFHLMDGKAMFRLAGVLYIGAQKYPRDNWRKIDSESHINHALQHLFAHQAGDRQDDHLGHAFCRLMMACATEVDEQ
jgi:hypothetical protein